MLETLRNAFKIKDLRKRIGFTFLMLIVVRIGSQLPIPGVDPDVFSQLFANNGDALNFFDAITGGSFENMSIFALNITPYITSSIIIQLLTIAFPKLEEMQRDGEQGRKKITQITRYVTVGLAIIQSVAMAIGFGRSGYLTEFNALYVIMTVAALTAGSSVLMWIGERITEKGIGNGISLIIMIGIVARLPHALLAEVNARFQTASGSAIMLILELVLLFLVFMATIALVQAVRKVPVQYAKRIVGNKQYGGVRQYIPLKMNAANVMPIIFAQALMFIPALFSGTAFAAAFSSMTGFWYNFTLAVLVIAFTYFYTAIIINPQMMADDMKRNGGFIPGVKPGKQTVNYIDTIMTRITLPGSFFLAIVAILPALAMKFLGIQQAFAYFYGGTSLLIMVGVVLDTLKQIESYLLMRHYDGLMKTGRIQGRH